MNITETQKFVATTVGGLIAVIIGALCYTSPPVLAIPDPWGVLFIGAGLVAFGVQINTGLSGARTKDALIEMANEAAERADG